MTNYNSMTVEELEAANAELMAERMALRQEQSHLVKVLDAKRKDEAVARELAALQARHGVTVQVVSPAGIDSEEAVGD